ncbi:MAG: hypothetical protein ABSC25_08155 [Roseiarcus sp.]|jgi:hypothetical protein
MVVTFKKLMAAIEADPEFAKQSVARSPEPEGDPRTTVEITRLFQFIGTYVVLFQDIEAKLDQIIMIAIGHDRPHVSEGVVSLLSHAQKIDLIHAIVRSSAIANGDPFRAEWLASFEDVIQRLKAEATRRNKIVHSAYILDFMEIGAPPLRSKRKRKRGDFDFDQEDIDAKFIGRATSELAELSFDVGMALTQLRHWSEPLGKTRPSTGNEVIESKT